MRARSERRASTRWASTLLLLGLTTIGCKPQNQATTPDSPSASADPSEDPLAQLARLEQQMREFGLPVGSTASLDATTPSGSATTEQEAKLGGAGEGAGAAMAEDEAPEAEPEPETATDAEPDVLEQTPPTAPITESRARTQQCADVCDLSVAICDLEQMICSLSDNHDGDSTYADACVRASDDCVVAGDACDRCG